MARLLFLVLMALVGLTQTAHVGITECEMKRIAAMQKWRIDPGNYIPRCDTNGDYMQS